MATRSRFVPDQEPTGPSARKKDEANSSTDRRPIDMDNTGRPGWCSRLRVKHLMIAIAACAMLAALVIALTPDVAWVGRATVLLEFVVLDGTTGKPIDCALISLIGATPEYATRTDAEGRAMIMITATAAGRSSRTTETRSVNYAWELEISADRYLTLNEALREITKESPYHSSDSPPPIVIRLDPAPRP
jgi:hypothetical protein